MRPEGPNPLRCAAPLAALLALALAAGASAAQLEVSASEPYVADQIVVALRPGSPADPHGPVLQGAVQPEDAVGTETLERLRSVQGVRQLRRVFRRLEDENGQLARRTRDEVRARLATRGLTSGATLDARLDRVPSLENIFIVELDGELSVVEAVATLSAEDEVVWAEPNWIYTITAAPLPAVPFVPDDRYVTQDGVTWSEGSVAESHPDLYGLRNTRAIEAWNEFDLDGSGSFDAGETRPGEEIVVAVIDSGVDASHPDLADNIWVNPGEVPGNGLDDDGNGLVDDVSGWDFVYDDPSPSDPLGHGTHVAGTIAALVGNAGRGIAGVAPYARILRLRALNESGSGNATDLAEAVDYAVAVGANITSNSWGGPQTSFVISNAFAAAEAAGLLNVSSAGNGNKDVSGQSPANLDAVMAVAAVEHDDERASFSNFGGLIEISAAGFNILSLNANGGDNRIAAARPANVVDGDYLTLSGTSMACPHVSAAAAVLMSAHPDESAEEIRGRVMAGARSIDAQNPSYIGQLGTGSLDLPGSLAAPPAPVLRMVEVSAQNVLAGQQAEITVWLRNFWTTATNATGLLTSVDPNLRIDRGSAGFGDIGIGEYASNDTERFLVTLDPDTPFGEIHFVLTLTADGGTSASAEFSLTISFLSDVSSRAGVVKGALLPLFNLFQDYDGDGHPDILMADLLTDYFFYRNQGDGTFRSSKREYGLPRSFSAWTSFFFDVDEDGDRDILLGGRVQDPSRLFQNQGDGPTVDVSEPSGIGQFGLPWSAALDYDGNGFVDIVGGDGRGSGPKADWGPIHLLQNQGDGTFIDRLPGSGLPDAPFPLGLGNVRTLDYDDDGDADVLFAGWGSGLTLSQNEGDGSFSDRTAAAFPDFSPTGMATVAVGDCDNDGDLDLYATANPSRFDPPSRILLNQGGVFADAGDAAGDVYAYNLTGVFGGAAFFDVDNDGDLDLYVSKDISFPGTSLPGLDRNPLFLNDGTCRFTLASDEAFPRGISPVGGVAAMADYDGDGDLDIYNPGSGIFGGPGGLLRNELGDDLHWLIVVLEGTESARDAYGARVTIEAGARSQMREIHTSPVDPGTVHFGLGDDTVVEHLEVRWPSGIRQVFHDIDADQRFRVVEVDCGAGSDHDGDGTCDTATIAIDIQPDRKFNLVVPQSRRAVPVALLGSGDFDATEVDVSSLAFGPEGAAPLQEVCGNAEHRGPGRRDEDEGRRHDEDPRGGACAPAPFVDDVDDDGLPDLVAHFQAREAGLTWERNLACVTGETIGGAAFVGCDLLRTVLGCGIGFELVLVLPPILALRARVRRARSREAARSAPV